MCLLVCVFVFKRCMCVRVHKAGHIFVCLCVHSHVNVHGCVHVLGAYVCSACWHLYACVYNKVIFLSL